VAKNGLRQGNLHDVFSLGTSSFITGTFGAYTEGLGLLLTRAQTNPILVRLL
jgi:hypothetical protein